MIGTLVFGVLIGVSLANGQWSLAGQLALLFGAYVVITSPARR